MCASIQNTTYQLGYAIGVPIWVLQKNSLLMIKLIRVVEKANKSDSNLKNKQLKLQKLTWVQLQKPWKMNNNIKLKDSLSVLLPRGSAPPFRREYSLRKVFDI